MDKRTARIAILDRPLIKAKSEVSLSAFALLFSEIVQYNQNRVASTTDLERKLEESGYGIGQRVIELVSCRDRATKRETRIVNMLQYISNVLWRYLFNKPADQLDRSTENEDEYMIHEYSAVTNSFVSVPGDMGRFNCAAFIAGIIAGILDSARFNAKVTAHLIANPAAQQSATHGGGLDAGGSGTHSGASTSGAFGSGLTADPLPTDRTVFLIKFSAEVMSRERKLG